MRIIIWSLARSKKPARKPVDTRLDVLRGNRHCRIRHPAGVIGAGVLRGPGRRTTGGGRESNGGVRFSQCRISAFNRRSHGYGRSGRVPHVGLTIEILHVDFLMGPPSNLVNTLRRSSPYLSFPPGRTRAFAVLITTVAETTCLLKCYWRKVVQWVVGEDVVGEPPTATSESGGSSRRSERETGYQRSATSIGDNTDMGDHDSQSIPAADHRMPQLT